MSDMFAEKDIGDIGEELRRGDLHGSGERAFALRRNAVEDGGGQLVDKAGNSLSQGLPGHF
ncbi:MAG: hypothetical protein IE886_00780 [Campylobacterales bacterium]|nr:hypothetical protein [Campylobacterales bacterium]